MQKLKRLLLMVNVSFLVQFPPIGIIARAQDAGTSISYSFSIPSKPLADALADFTAVTGIQIALPQDRKIIAISAPANGRLTPTAAMDSILRGTNLRFRFVANNLVTIYNLSDAQNDTGAVTGDTTVLQPITLAGETAWGRVDGFVAHRSATATKTDTPLHETPMTVNVVTSDQIKILGSSTLGNTLRYTPGVITEFQQSTSYFDRIRLRGFYSNNNIYLDGTQLTPSGTLAVAQADPTMLERVEVLKGPASVLYGQNGTGGLINMVSKRPLGNNQHALGFSFGSDDYAEMTFDLNGISEDRAISYRLSGVARNSELENDNADVRRFAVAPSLTWKPSEVTSLTLMAGIQHDPDGNSSSYLPATGMILPNGNGRFPRGIYTCDPSFCEYDRSQYYLSSDFRHVFNDALEFRQNMRLTYVDVSLQTLNPGALQSDQRSIARTAQSQRATTRGISIDNSVRYRFDLGASKNDLIAGLDYRRFSSDNLSLTGTNSSLNLDLFAPVYGNLSIPTLSRRTDNEVVLQQYGIYLLNQISIQNWRVTLGLRHDWATSDTDNHLTDQNAEISDHALTGRLGLLYLFDNGIAPYASYSTSFEQTSGTDYFGNAFEPSEGKQWEIGIKYEPTRINGLVSLAMYDLTRQNVTTADNVHTCAAAPNLADCGDFSVQTGEVRVKGIEIEGKLSLTDRLNASLAYTYMDAEVTQSNDGYTGKTPTNTPRNMVSAWLDYTFNSGFFEGLTVGSGVRYVGRMYADDANAAPIPSYTLVDASVSYDLGVLAPRLEGAKLSISATNLADRRAVGGCTSASYCDYVAGRKIIGSLNVKF